MRGCGLTWDGANKASYGDSILFVCHMLCIFVHDNVLEMFLIVTSLTFLFLVRCGLLLCCSDIKLLVTILLPFVLTLSPVIVSDINSLLFFFSLKFKV